MSLPWPIRGTIDFATTPRWWGWPLLALVLMLALCLGAGFGVFTWLRPDPDLSWWRAIIAWAVSVSASLGAMVATWICLQPLVLGFVFEAVIVQVQREAGARPAAGENVIGGVASALRVLLRTLPMRGTSLAVVVLSSLLLGPFGVIPIALVMTRVALFDACEAALAARGFTGAQRLRLLARHGDDLRRVLLPAACLHLLILVPILGWVVWVFWLPGFLVGAARTVLTWEADLPADSAQGG